MENKINTMTIILAKLMVMLINCKWKILVFLLKWINYMHEAEFHHDFAPYWNGVARKIDQGTYPFPMLTYTSDEWPG